VVCVSHDPPACLANWPRSAPAWIRGTVVAAYQWAITIGLLIASVVNNATQGREDSGAWRIPVGVQFAWGIVLAAGMLALPESPRYLVMRGRDGQAAAALGRLTKREADDVHVLAEVAAIRESYEEELKHGVTTYLGCFKNDGAKMGLRTLTGIFLQAWQQLTGELSLNSALTMAES
jgi:SP family sugar:H+ symporter-like MFS transporter